MPLASSSFVLVRPFLPPLAPGSRPGTSFPISNTRLLLAVSWTPLVTKSEYTASFQAGAELAAGDLWENPEGDSGSDWDEMDRKEDEQQGDDEKKEEEEDEGKEAGSAARGTALAVSAAEYKKLVTEVELLLNPEEKAILQQNEGPNLSKISSRKWSPFHSLAVATQIPFMDNLLKSGIHIESVDKDGFTALHKAVIGKKEAVISHLLRKGANPHVRDRDGATPLHYAVQVGAMQCVKLLIKYKVDVNVADNEGWTPLHLAIQSRNRDIVKVLLVNGADKSRRNKDGKMPLDISLCFGKDFKSYDLARLIKLVPANRDL